jgi:hypothetical protein
MQFIVKKSNFKKGKVLVKKKTGHTIAFFERALLKVSPDKEL